jgi:PilZ domain
MGIFVTERRQMTRYDFGAIAEVIDLDSREDMIVVTRDLSFSGCFVKTRTPFPAGTEVRVRMTYAGSDFSAIGSVTENINREGMGIEFVEIAPEDQAIIEAWLGVSHTERYDATGASPGRTVRLRNRLCPQEHRRRITPISGKPEADRPGLIANESPGLSRNLGDIRDEAEQ